MRRLSRRPELPMAHVQIPQVPQPPVQIPDFPEPVQIPMSYVPEPPVHFPYVPEPVQILHVSEPPVRIPDAPEPPVQIAPVQIAPVQNALVQISLVPEPPVKIPDVPEPVQIPHVPEIPVKILPVSEPMQILHVPELMQILLEFDTLETLEPTDAFDHLISFAFGSPAQDLQLLHTIPSIFDGDLISILDEFERELVPMDLTMPRLNPCVKTFIGFKAIQPMDLSVNSCL
ncbi:hypothetical protein TNCV_3563321 [Trichonephila clavipes]|nr:hypothetical protein TNCV_3563321 [Trichonephila clavipes]